MTRFVKAHATDEGVLDILAAPYGGPHSGKDKHGQFFSLNTDFKEKIIPFPPIFYHHGGALGNSAEPIGETLYRWNDHLGHWFRVKLDMANELAQKVWKAAQKLEAFASSGAVPASIDGDKSTGEILSWLIGELSVFDLNEEEGRLPANSYAVAVPHLAALKSFVPDEHQPLFNEVYLVGDATPPRPGKDQLKRKQSMKMMEQLTAHLRQMLSMLESGGDSYGDDYDNDMMTKSEGGGEDAPPATKAEGEDSTPPSEKAELHVVGCKCYGCQNQDVKCYNPGNLPIVTTPPQGHSTREESDDTIENPARRYATKSEKGWGTPTTTREVDPQVKTLQTEVAALKADVAARENASWVQEMIAAGKLLPAEQESTLQALAAAYTSGNQTVLSSLKSMVDARPVLQQNFDASTGLKVAGFEGTMTADEVDTAYLERLRGYASKPTRPERAEV